jgi:hypothetical protein
MMGTEMVSEMSVIFNQLTWLIAQEDFIHIFISVVLWTLITAELILVFLI